MRGPYTSPTRDMTPTQRERWFRAEGEKNKRNAITAESTYVNAGNLISHVADYERRPPRQAVREWYRKGHLCL